MDFIKKNSFVIILTSLLSGCPGTYRFTTSPLQDSTPDFIPHKKIIFEGTCGYTINKDSGQLELRAEKIAHYGPQELSGTLRLSLWATEYPYNGLALNGYILGSSILGQLKGGKTLLNTTQKVSFVAPESGEYFMILAIQEYDITGSWGIQDTCILKNKGFF
ncbi:hypothetical protein AltI4_18690 [Alteromonas sp. I4]|nr:hypothetical protein AltI4_18690 [Alteromonas sp. I4]